MVAFERRGMRAATMAAVLVCAFVPVASAQKAVLLVRHAEKVDDSDHALLSSVGKARAKRIRRDHPADVVLVVGHSNTLPKVLRLLGHTEPVEIPHDAFGDLFVAIPREGGPPTVLRLKY